MIGTIFLGACITGVAFCLFMLWRNNRVYAYRSEVLRRTSAQAKILINRGEYDSWRALYVPLDEITYDEMMRQFWRPLSSFGLDRLVRDEGL